jgi:hypothetical protein
MSNGEDTRQIHIDATGDLRDRGRRVIRPAGGHGVHRGKESLMAGMLALTGGAATLLWILAVILVIAGIVSIIRGGVLAGIVLIIVGLLIGPGGVSIF